MRRLKIALWLECYALLLAVMQEHNGVRTDEAKYLLDIPYPHPPLARWFFSLFDGFAWQEFFVRALVATLLVQAVWIAWDMARSLRPSGKIAVAVLWLGSAAFVLQAGTAMMAPLTALQALVFLWILSLPKERLPGAPAVGFLWLATLFTALQGVLLAPLAIAALRINGTPVRGRLWYIGAPLVLVGLYVLGNPLIAASLLIQSGKDAGDPMVVRAAGLLWILVLAGSGVGAFVGVLGIALKKHVWITASFLLVLAYVFVGRFDYYAILFLPFFVTGTKHLLRRMPRVAIPMAVGVVLGTAAILASWMPLLSDRSLARETLERAGTGTILVRGSMGHEWQYEASSGQDVRPYAEALAPDAKAVVCFTECDDLEEDWISLSSVRGLWLPR
jgi:hypothetical protein